MKKLLITAAFATFTTMGYSQAVTPGNVFPLPSGSVGIGTTSPICKLDVVTNSMPSGSFTNHAFFGSRVTTTIGMPPVTTTSFNGLYIQQDASVMRLQSIYPKTLKAYIDFNALATTNTTRAAVSFGLGSKELMRINTDGKVRISDGANDITTPGDYRLYVEEGILTEKVRVSLESTADWADYVFESDYQLMPLKEVEAYTQENGHLPNVPSAEEMVANGLDVAQMDAKLLEKVEELTLYLIEQQKQIEALKAEIETLKEQKK